MNKLLNYALKIYKWLKSKTINLTPITLFIAIITLVTSIYFLGLMYNNKYINITEIPFGLGPFNVESRDQLEMKYVYMLKEANDYLRKNSSRYRFFPKVSESERYTDLFNILKSDNPEYMRFIVISPYTYLLYKKDMLQIPKKELDKRIDYIGYERIDSKTTYYSYMIWNNNNKFQYKNIEDILINLAYTDSTVILTSEARSTSGHVIPQVFLIEHGINIKGKTYLSKSRNDMITTIINNNDKLLVGFISDRDYESLPNEKKERLKYYKIGIPIPNDIFFVNKKWWEDLPSPEQKNIEESLKNAGHFNLVAKSSRDTVFYKYDIFDKYVFSGIVQQNKEDTTIIIPDEPFDSLFKKKTKEESKQVRLYKFCVYNKSSTYSTLDTILIGKARIKYDCCNKYRFQGKPTDMSGKPIKDTIKMKGLHVLPY